MNEEPWYGAKCIFRHNDRQTADGFMYEERIILLKAERADAAIARAEKEAQTYAADLSGCEFIEFVDVFHLFDETIGDGTEIYSLMRLSNLDKDKYLDTFYNTGSERTTVA